MTAASGHKYYPALDTLRALAVATVLTAHFSPTAGRWINGSIGVQLFFVLSGFLITGLLLQARSRIDAGRSSVWAECSVFFRRRTLRIFPLYYGVIAIAVLFNFEHARATAGWLLTYSYNFRVWLAGGWPDRLLSHFWSLAVEEQFYLFWPWLVLCAPRRVLPWVILALFFGGLLFRSAMSHGTPEAIVGSQVLLPACLQYLGAGALLAWARSEGWLASQRLDVLAKIVCAACFARFVAGFFYLPMLFRLYDATNAIFFALLIHFCARDSTHAVRRLMEWSVTVYLGRISYGIYVLHNFMHYIGPGLSRRLFGIRYFPREWEHALWLSALSVAAAALSYHFYERPWQGLKPNWSAAGSSKTPPFKSEIPASSAPAP